MSEWRACGRERTGGGVGACLPRRRSAFSCCVFVVWPRALCGARVSPCVLAGGCEGVSARWLCGARVGVCPCVPLVCRVFGFRVGVCYGVGVAAIFTW